MLMSSLPSLLFSAAGQVDEEETEAKKGIQMENKLQKRWLLLERRKDTQRGVAGGGRLQPSWHGLGPAAHKSHRNQSGAGSDAGDISRYFGDFASVQTPDSGSVFFEPFFSFQIENLTFAP